MTRGEIWWSELPEPAGRRPVLVVQADRFNLSRINSIVVVPLTGNMAAAGMPDNVLFPASETGLPRDSVANVSQVGAVHRSLLTARVGRAPPHLIQAVEDGLREVLDL